MTLEVHVLPVDWSSHSAVLQTIRGQVFIQEQGVAKEIEWDGQDDDAHHFLAINAAGQSIGCARLLPSGQIGRMAVLAEHREGGIGLRLLELAVEEAKKLGFSQLFLNAQTHAERFYRKAGFMPVGGEFMEAGIPHQRMELVLPLPFSAPEGLSSPVIRQEEADPARAAGELIPHRGEQASVDALVSILQTPHRQVRLYSQHLDHGIFDDPRVVDAISTFVRHGPPATLQILLHSSSAIISRGHRLMELARRLSSKVKVRVVPGELAVDRQTYVICDEQAFWLLPDHQEYQGFSNVYDPVQANRMVERFDYLWERGQSDPNLRTLSV